MLTQTKENYLKALYHLHQKDEAITISDLGAEMAVSKPTVNDMVKKLQAKGWVKYERYKPIHLTSQGKKEAAIIIRKHRLSEMFLSQIMGFGWEEVHEMAEEIEHLRTDKFFDRMDELLGFPTVDPHGSPIPDKEGNITEANYKRLSQIQEGKTVIIKALKESSTEFLLFLNKKEIRLGTKLTVNQIETFDKSYTVSYGKLTDVVLSYKICQSLLVETVD